jgi:hypothetical protein
LTQVKGSRRHIVNLTGLSAAVIERGLSMSRGLEELYGDHVRMRMLLRLLQSQIDGYRQGEVPDFELLQSMMGDL